MNEIINESILEQKEFDRADSEFIRELYKKEFYVDNYSEWQYSTIKEDGEDNYINISLSKGLTNNGAAWHVHIDNNTCCTIGSADISTIKQFNMLMEIFNSKFKI